MKKFLYTTLVLLLFCTFQSCDKHMDHETKQVALNATLAGGAEYTLNLAQYGDADDVAAISTQATNFTVSEISNTAGTFAPVYHYAAFSKIAATDKVVLTVSEGNSNGRCGHKGASTVITINFTIQ